MPYTSSSAASSPARSSSGTPSPIPRSTGQTPSTPPRFAQSTPDPPPSRLKQSAKKSPESPLLNRLRKLDPEEGTPSKLRRTKNKAKFESDTPRSAQSTLQSAGSERGASVESSGRKSNQARIPWTNGERAEIVAQILSEMETSSETWRALACKLTNRKPVDIKQQYTRSILPALQGLYGVRVVGGIKGEEEAPSNGKRRAEGSSKNSKKRSRRAFDKQEDGSNEEDRYDS